MCLIIDFKKWPKMFLKVSQVMEGKGKKTGISRE
jgi:hypothetical protein